MVIVIDSSVMMAWCFTDEATGTTEAVLDKLLETKALVPAIWPLEIANVLLNGERRQRLTVAQSTHFVELLGSLPIIIADGEGFLMAFGSIMELGREYGLSSYDAGYLELAARHGVPLATQDTKLALAAERIGVPLVHPVR